MLKYLRTPRDGEYRKTREYYRVEIPKKTEGPIVITYCIQMILLTLLLPEPDDP